jgi:hypothetical protein
MNKFLLALLQELKFKCSDCLKAFPLKVLKTHKKTGLCFRDEHNDDGDQVMAEF